MSEGGWTLTKWPNLEHCTQFREYVLIICVLITQNRYFGKSICKNCHSIGGRGGRREASAICKILPRVRSLAEKKNSGTTLILNYIFQKCRRFGHYYEWHGSSGHALFNALLLWVNAQWNVGRPVRMTRAAQRKWLFWIFIWLEVLIKNLSEESYSEHSPETLPRN